MPVCSQHRAFPWVDYRTEGTQYIDGEVIFPSSGTTTVYLSRDIYASGVYRLFDYSASTSSSPVQNLSNLTIDISDLLLASAATIANDAARKVVTVELTALTSNGTQYIDGTLNIAGPVSVYLAEDLYGTAGTYVLFEFVSLSGSVANLTVYPPVGRRLDTSVSGNGCAISGSTITCTLI